MTPSSQKAAARPISFVLHDTAAGAAPFEYPMTIRPEDLQRNEPSRLSVHQTFGGDGGFVDSFGPGVASLTISGHTGWHGTKYDDGMALFDRLRLAVFQEWHGARKRAVARNQDPDLVKLIFIDALDNFAWVCAPQQFTLRRSRSQPLLMKYNISLIRLADDISGAQAPINGAGKPKNPVAALQQRTSALSSLMQSIANIAKFVTTLVGNVAAAIGAIVGPLVAFTNTVLSVLNQVMGAVNSVVSLAHTLAQAATQVTSCLSAIESIPAMVRASLQQAAAEFRNAFCLIGNIFNKTTTYPDYSSFYGGSNCSSTWIGGQVSPYSQAGTSGIATLFPATPATGTQTAAQAAAAHDLASMDVVLNPQSPSWMAARMKAVTNG